MNSWFEAVRPPVIPIPLHEVEDFNRYASLLSENLRYGDSTYPTPTPRWKSIRVDQKTGGFIVHRFTSPEGAAPAYEPLSTTEYDVRDSLLTEIRGYADDAALARHASDYRTLFTYDSLRRLSDMRVKRADSAAAYHVTVSYSGTRPSEMVMKLAPWDSTQPETNRIRYTWEPLDSGVAETRWSWNGGQWNVEVRTERRYAGNALVSLNQFQSPNFSHLFLRAHYAYDGEGRIAEIDYPFIDSNGVHDTLLSRIRFSYAGDSSEAREEMVLLPKDSSQARAWKISFDCGCRPVRFFLSQDGKLSGWEEYDREYFVPAAVRFQAPELRRSRAGVRSDALGRRREKPGPIPFFLIPK